MNPLLKVGLGGAVATDVIASVPADTDDLKKIGIGLLASFFTHLAVEIAKQIPKLFRQLKERKKPYPDPVVTEMPVTPITKPPRSSRKRVSAPPALIED